MSVRPPALLSTPDSLRLDALAVGPDRVAVGAITGEVLLAKDDGLHGVRGHTFAVTALAFAPDGRLASAGIDGRIRVWSPDLALIAEHAGPAPILKVGWCRDTPVAGDGDGGVWFGAVRHPGHDGPVTALVVDGDDVWTAGTDGRIRRWTPGGPDDVARHPAAIEALAVGDGEVVAGTADGTVVVHGDRPRRWVCGTSEVFWVARSTHGVVAATTDGRVHVDGRSFAIGTDGVFPLVVDGDRVWVVTAEGARGWWLATGTPSAVLAPAGHGPKRIAIGGDRIWSAGRGVVGWPRPPGDDGPFDHVGLVRGLVRWGQGVVSHGNDGAVILRDETGAGRRWIEVHPGICWAVAVSPDGRRLATGSDERVTVFDADGTRIGSWSTPGHALCWLDDQRLATGGGRVRLATVTLGEVDVQPIAAAGTTFDAQTHWLERLPDGRIVAASSVRTPGIAFDLRTGATTEVTATEPSKPDTGLRTNRAGEVGATVASVEVPELHGPRVTGDLPPLPDAAGPPWFRSWLAGALFRTCQPPAALAHGLRGRGLPADPAVIAWEAGHGSYRVVATHVGYAGLPIPDAWVPRDGPPRLWIGHDWPSRFYGDADGGLWERCLGVDRRIGTLADLPPLLALRAAAGSPVARWVVDGLHGETIAAAVGADPVAVGTTRWWLGPSALVSEDDGRTEVAVSNPKTLAAAVRIVSAPMRITTTGTVKIVPLADAPPMPDRPPDARPLRSSSEGFVDPGPPVRQIEGRDGRQVQAVTVGKATTRWVRLTGERPAAASASARAWLAAQKAEHDPLATAGPEALAALLNCRGFRVHDGVLAAERALGGLRFADPEDRSEPWFAFGAWQYLALWPYGWTFAAADIARGLVPFVSGPGDSVYAVDPDGQLWWQEMIAMGVPVVVASSPVVWLERIVRDAEAPRVVLEVDGLHGAAVAAQLGATFVPEASDPFERWWTGPAVAVIEPFDGQAVLDGDPPVARTRVQVPKAGLRAATAVLQPFGEVRRR